jgi:hypothetical protein
MALPFAFTRGQTPRSHHRPTDFQRQPSLVKRTAAITNLGRPRGTALRQIRIVHDRSAALKRDPADARRDGARFSRGAKTRNPRA